MNIRVPPAIDSACMRVALAEQTINDAIVDPNNSSWLRSALVVMQQRDAEVALADATTLFRLMSERAISTNALVAALDSVR